MVFGPTEKMEDEDLTIVIIIVGSLVGVLLVWGRVGVGKFLRLRVRVLVREWLRAE